MTSALDINALLHLPREVARPDYDFANLGIGILHLGLGAFHRAHQAVFTEDAILAAGGAWGIASAAFRHVTIPEALRAQDHLYTIETLTEAPRYRVSAVIRSALTAAAESARLRSQFADGRIHIVTLTVTEKGYCLDQDGQLDVSNEGVVFDLKHPFHPQTAIGWLALGLHDRFVSRGPPVTVISCDNLKDNGLKLKRAVEAFLERSHPETLPWLRGNVSFPRSVVDCIVPASSEASRKRVDKAVGAIDGASVQREPYSQWAIENDFAGPRPAWERVGAQIVGNVDINALLKLHILNACHSALAYLGLSRGYEFVREAASDPELAAFVNGMVEQEVAPALAPLETQSYWSAVSRRFCNPLIDHRLSQIAEDGAVKMSQRIFPLMLANEEKSAPIARLARVTRAWLDFKGIDAEAALNDPSLFPRAIAGNASARAAILSAVT